MEITVVSIGFGPPKAKTVVLAAEDTKAEVPAKVASAIEFEEVAR